MSAHAQAGVATGEAIPDYDSAHLPPPFRDELVQAWRYRDLIGQLIARDIRARYKRSVLGVAWTMINPLMMMAILALVFSHLFRFELPNYHIYLLAGIVLWTFFSQTTTSIGTHLLWGGTLLNRIYVPRTVFALSAVGTGLVNFVLSLVPLLAIAALAQAPLGPSLVWLPVAMVLAACFALGVGMLVSSLALEFPDVAEMFQIVLSAWFFLTPILYPQQIFPPEYRWVLNFNPVYHILEVFRYPLYWGTPAGHLTILAAVGATAITLVLGWLVFTVRAERIAYQS